MYSIIIVDGYVSRAPEYKVTKQGRKYATLSLFSSNGTNYDGTPMQVYYNCFCYEGDVYKHIARLRISNGDRISVHGKFSVNKKTNGDSFYNIYLQGIELISSQIANKIGKAEAEYEPEVQVNQQVQSFNGEEQPTNNDESFDY